MDYITLKKTLINNIQPIKLIYDFIEIINEDFNLYNGDFNLYNDSENKITIIEMINDNCSSYKNEYIYNECKNKINMIKNKIDDIIFNIINNMLKYSDKKIIIMCLSDREKKDVDIYHKQLKTIQKLLTNINK